MTADNHVLRFGIPKGSLEAQTIELMRKSGWRIAVGDRSYIPRVDDPSLSCRLLRPQEMPRYIADGTLDAGITGSDWIVENAVDLIEVESFIYSKVSLQPTRWVLCVPERSPVQRLEDLEGKRVATEMVAFTRRVFEERNVNVDIEFSWGVTEAKPRPVRRCAPTACASSSSCSLRHRYWWRILMPGLIHGSRRKSARSVY
jgi:ATP phosphoribosyltransferase